MNTRFTYLCKEGKLDDAKELYKNAIFCQATAFNETCFNGHLNVAQWLYSLGGINIHINEDIIFRQSCWRGYLDMAQWLYSLEYINIHINNDEAFRWSCYYGHLNVIKWLYSLDSIDIHVDNDYSLMASCNNNCCDVIKWLLLTDKFNNFLVDEYLPDQLYDYAFELGYLPVNKMKTAYAKYKNKIRDKLLENNENGQISIFELKDLVNIISIYV